MTDCASVIVFRAAAILQSSIFAPILFWSIATNTYSA